MTLRSLARAWNDFFFNPQPPQAMGLYRIVYGLLIIADLILLRPDWFTWYGTRGFLSLDTIRRMEPGTRINLFTVMPYNDTWINALFWVFLLFAVFLMFGFMTRLSSIVVYVCLASIHQRNLFILHAGDTLLRVCGFFLIFAPAGAAFSVDRLIRLWRGKEGPEHAPRMPWAQRMIQIQVALVYLATFIWKSTGATWVDGTAMYYALHMPEFQRFPMPEFQSMLAIKLGTWLTLAVEFAGGVLIWFKDLRYWVLAAGLALHLSIEYSMNIPLFQWIIVAGYLVFIYPADLRRAGQWVREKAATHIEPVPVLFDGTCARVKRLAYVLDAIDVLGRLQIVDVHSAPARELWPDVTVQEMRTRLRVGAGGQWVEGFRALLGISPVVPLLWPLAPFALATAHFRPAASTASAAQ